MVASAPQSTSSAWAERDAAVVWHGFTQMSTFLANEPIIAVAGEGCWLVDADGKRYLDAISSLWVNTLGHNHPELNRALVEQGTKLAHATLLGNGTVSSIKLAEQLVKHCPIDSGHVIFASDGAAAVEQAARIAYQYWANIGEPRTEFLALGNAYHGDTIGALSLGAGGFGTEMLDPLRFPTLRTPGYDVAGHGELAAATIRAKHPAAVIVEPLVQGAAGMLISSPAEMAPIAQACSETGTLLIADEVAVGFGRTGALFASELCGWHPDLLVVGKGLTGGYLPMSATIANQRVFEAFLGPDLSERTLYHGHSYSGNAIAAAVATRHLEVFYEDDILAHVNTTAPVFAEALDRLSTHPLVTAVRHLGLVGAVELASDLPDLAPRRVAREAVRSGVLLRSLGRTIPIVPPLVITPAEIELIATTLRRALDTIANQLANERSGQ